MVVFVVAAALGFVRQASAKDASVTIQNQSDWEIHQFFLSSADNDDWGPDQLRNDVIGKGKSFKLNGIPCDTYDVKLVDEDGDECVVKGVDICSKGATWTIGSKDLVSCQQKSH
jgi:hypothetical protein